MLLSRKSGCKGTNKYATHQTNRQIISIFLGFSIGKYYFCPLKQHKNMAIRALSILIPTYNDPCVTLVETLRHQAEAAAIRYEIIVGDDGSTSEDTIKANEVIASMPNCSYLRREQNTGRAAIRNYLVKKALYPYVLFVDSDMTVINSQFLANYLDADCDGVIDGGIAIMPEKTGLNGNLRYLYEHAEAHRHTAEERQQQPYQHIHTANLLVRRDIMGEHPFDERFRHYGYEDVFFGKTLRQHKIPIQHIDNPLGFCIFETNSDFVAKTEEGLRTLHEFRDDLRGYSRLLTFVSGIHVPLVLSAIRLWHRLFGAAERRNLCGTSPSLTLFKYYKLGYYLSL